MLAGGDVILHYVLILVSHLVSFDLNVNKMFWCLRGQQQLAGCSFRNVALQRLCLPAAAGLVQLVPLNSELRPEGGPLTSSLFISGREKWIRTEAEQALGLSMHRHSF